MLYAFENQQLKNYAPVAQDGPTDEQLMISIQAKDQRALAALCQRHAPLLRTVIDRIVHNTHDVEDLMQELFLEIWNRADHYCEQKGKALGWVVTMARRRAIDKLRKKQAYGRAEERLRLETETAPPLAVCHGPDEDAVATDTCELFKRAIQSLPVAQQQAVQLAFYRGMSQREIAAHTGIPLGTIKTRLELAIRKLRAAVLALGGASEWLPSSQGC